ncbi:hypothetical protein [Microbacterium aerolatum]|uniref:hypothetical protein n=1 Tax=Microbacterium aerolatum TaxID=153731 RepID=UPI00384D0309
MTHRVGWHITVAGLQKRGPEGRDAIRSAVNELAKHGYLIRRQTQGDGGRFNEIEYEISDPSTGVGFPTAVGFSDTGGFTDDGSADVGESDTKNNIPQNTIDEEPHAEDEHSSAPAARDLMQDFEKAWVNWPNRVKRKDSNKAFMKVAKTRDVDELVADIIRFGNAYAATTEKRYVPALCVWLNGERWTDELPTGAPSRQSAAGRNAAYLRNTFGITSLEVKTSSDFAPGHVPSEDEWDALLARVPEKPSVEPVVELPARPAETFVFCEEHPKYPIIDGACAECVRLEQTRGAA